MYRYHVRFAYDLRQRDPLLHARRVASYFNSFDSCLSAEAHQVGGRECVVLTHWTTREEAQASLASGGTNAILAGKAGLLASTPSTWESTSRSDA